MHPGTSSTREVEAGGSDVQGYTHLHSSQDLPGIYETLGGRDGGGNEGLEAGLTARTDICERIHMLAQGTKVSGRQEHLYQSSFGDCPQQDGSSLSIHPQYQQQSPNVSPRAQKCYSRLWGLHEGVFPQLAVRTAINKCLVVLARKPCDPLPWEALELAQAHGPQTRPGCLRCDSIPKGHSDF